MRAGRLRHVIVIEQQSGSQDEYGAPGVTWSTFATVRAGVEPTMGKERFATAQTVAEADTVFTIRYLAGVLPTMRILHDGRVFNIAAPAMDPDGRKRELRLLATEVVS
jgi:SPP1 family predicted phage head-tail adaptor